MDKGHLITFSTVVVSTGIIVASIYNAVTPKKEVIIEKVPFVVMATATPSATLTPFKGKIIITTVPTKAVK